MFEIKYCVENIKDFWDNMRSVFLITNDCCHSCVCICSLLEVAIGKCILYNTNNKNIMYVNTWDI